jgi:hypothetical protein
VVPVPCYALVAVGWLSPGYSPERPWPPQEGFIEAKHLTAADMEQVRQLVRPSGRKPWLISGFRRDLRAKSTPRRTWLGVYLQPDVESGRLRRGRVLYLEISAPTGVGKKASGRIESTAKYAQVVVPGGRPDEGKRKWDLQRPFLVDGEFDDETLFGLVELIRSNPEVPPQPNGAPSVRVRGSLPISRVRRTENGVEVTLEGDDAHGWFVNLRERNGRLVIVRRRAWIASQN